MGRKALVTGAGGFIGSRVVRALQRQGHEAVAVLREGADDSRLREFSPGVTVLRGDLRQKPSVDQILQQSYPDILIHLAWHIEQGAYLSSLSNLMDIETSLHLFQAAHRHGCSRIIGTGSCFEYDTSYGYLSEGTPLAPTSIFSASKMAVYLAGSAWARATGASFAWARPFYVYGPAEDERRLVPDVIRALLQKRDLATTTGEQVRDYLHVDDLANGIVGLAVSSATGAINIASGKPTTVREMVERIAAQIGASELIQFGARQQAAGDPRFVCANVSRIRDELCWKPLKSLDDGLFDTISWWRRTLS